MERGEFIGEMGNGSGGATAASHREEAVVFILGFDELEMVGAELACEDHYRFLWCRVVLGVVPKVSGDEIEIDVARRVLRVNVDDATLAIINAGSSVEYYTDAHEEAERAGARAQAKRRAQGVRGRLRGGGHTASHVSPLNAE